jgi:hypothetical protein
LCDWQDTPSFQEFDKYSDAMAEQEIRRMARLKKV